MDLLTLLKGDWLSREVAVVLLVKLLAIVLLWWFFFDLPDDHVLSTQDMQNQIIGPAVSPSSSASKKQVKL